VLDSLYHFCHASGSTSKCALYSNSSSTAADIRARAERILSTLRETPIALPFASNGPILITHADIESLLFSATYSPLRSFPIVANALVALESRNISVLASLSQNFNVGFQCPACQGGGSDKKLPTVAMSEASRAIQCADAGEVPFDMDDYAAYAAALANVSRVAGKSSAIDFLDCTEWSVRAPGRYTGPFNSSATTASTGSSESASARPQAPILLVSPRYDPVCPLSEARIVQANFPGTALLVQNSHGHCSVSAPSLCTAKIIREYFVSGQVPEEGKECDVDVLPFVGKVSSASQGLSLSGHSEEDEELARALESLTSMPMSMQR
jgi:pimeloyl-ACP methyl ester carboxylesterase